MKWFTGAAGGAAIVLIGFLAFGDAPEEADAEELWIAPVIVKGFEAYKRDGAEAAMQSWLEASPLEEHFPPGKLVQPLKKLEGLYGRYKTFHPIRVNRLTPTSRIVYLASDHQRGALFWSFLTYKTERGWIVTFVNTNTQPGRILPTSVVSRGPEGSEDVRTLLPDQPGGDSTGF